MKKFLLFLLPVLFFPLYPVVADIALEPCTYSENFETCELSAWASYPFWQDTAYDPNIRPDKIVPGDPNLSLVEKVTPYTHVDNYAGAQKELDMYLTPGSKVSLRYYMKTTVPPEFLKVRLAAGSDGKIDYTVTYPKTNGWQTLTLSYEDFAVNAPKSAAGRIKVNAIAVLVKFPGADPAMPIFLGLDDVKIDGMAAASFKFSEPEVVKLSEWKPFIPKQHYKKGDIFKIRGKWNLDASDITVEAVNYTKPSEKAFSAKMKKQNGEWVLPGVKLDIKEGLYLVTLTAFKGKEKLSGTTMTFLIVPDGLSGKHPRLWFDAEKKKWVESRLKSDRFKTVYDGMKTSASGDRTKTPLDKVVFDIDQFPKEEWLATLVPWFDRIVSWGDAVYDNSLEYSLDGDKEAGEYAKSLLVKISGFPFWLHPWMENRGQHIYYPIGEMGMKLALGYDFLYDLMTESERKTVRDALMKNVVLGCHRSYVEDDLVISNSSNWVAHITGGSLMCQAAFYGDGSDVAVLEPYLTGALMKDYAVIQGAIDSDGAYGEGYGYYSFSMLSWSKSIPAVENVFNVDLSGKIDGSYKELIWAGLVKDKKTFYFGDSGGDLGAATNWAWLLPKYKDPLLGWFYNYLKSGETFMDVLYETSDVAKKDPFTENPVKFFRNVGTTVFKSGWEKDDLSFVMRTGPFINHQHIDQGTFWLSFGGEPLIEERHNSTYYEDPIYQPWYTQPVAHSTILIDHNHQSQRVGDMLGFEDGFDDYAYLDQYFDGAKAAFSSGDIGRLYWGKVKDIRRNVLYIKPGIIIMMDEITPGMKNVDVTLLYQTKHLADITSDREISRISKNGSSLYIHHISPENAVVATEETPHYLYTLRNDKPLEREGMLTVTAKTNIDPLVMANIITASKGESPEVTHRKDGFSVYGKAGGASYAFTTKPGAVYSAYGFDTDAAAFTFENDVKLFALCKTAVEKGKMILKSDVPMTFEISSGFIKYFRTVSGKASIGLNNQPKMIKVNGQKTEYRFDKNSMSAEILLPGGTGVLEICY